MRLDKLIRNNLLAIAAAYCEATGNSLAQVGKEFYGRGSFFTELRKGKRSLSIRSVADMLEKFQKQWPPEAAWPMTRTIYMGQHGKE